MNHRQLLRLVRSTRPPVGPAPPLTEGLLAEQWRRRGALAARGHAIWGYVVMANDKVWAGTSHNPGYVLYSHDPWYEGHPSDLRWIADAVGAFYGSTQPERDPAVRAIQDRVRTGLDVHFGVRLPDALTGGRVVFLSAVMLWIADLPGGRLVDRVVPLWVDDDGYAMAVVAEAWPEPLRAAWEGSEA